MMRLDEALREECINVGVVLKDKRNALVEVARCAKNSPILRDVDEDVIVRGLEEREGLGSTGFGNGIAIPHCRLKEADDFVVGILTVPDGVEFDTLDNKKARLIVFIVAPDEASNEHIHLLSAISQALHGKGAVREILAGKTGEAVRESFLRFSRGELDTEGHRGKHLMHVFVQDETVFHDIIQVFAGMDTVSVMVVTSENLRTYFSKVPLFQGLWSHDPGGFSHIIVAVTGKNMTNETVRRIETITGDLDDRNDVMITVQELFYSAGSLTP